jgi:hypothetical protein
MAITFTPVELDTRNGDRTGLLVFDEGRLAAVLCRLDADHGDQAGRWFVETIFHEACGAQSQTFESPEEFAASLR